MLVLNNSPFLFNLGSQPGDRAVYTYGMSFLLVSFSANTLTEPLKVMSPR